MVRENAVMDSNKFRLVLALLLVSTLCGCKDSSDDKSDEFVNKNEEIIVVVEQDEIEDNSDKIASSEEEFSGSYEADITEKGKLVVLDPGHQIKGNSDTEQIGPGAQEKKPKVSSGTQGVVSGLKEYELNLNVALKLRDVLESRGYEVVMTRETSDVDISNSERAEIANNLNADAFVRIHANGDNSPSRVGMMTICQTKNNPYCADTYNECFALSSCILDAMVESTGANKEYVWETDTMSGINWCKIPTTIVEMGYMTNEKEDKLLASDDYQNAIAEGIANGIDLFFEGNYSLNEGTEEVNKEVVETSMKEE